MIFHIDVVFYYNDCICTIFNIFSKYLEVSKKSCHLQIDVVSLFPYLINMIFTSFSLPNSWQNTPLQC